MFKLENADKFDRFFATEQGQKPSRVKEKGAEPRHAWELTKVNTANAGGIALHAGGRTTATPRFKVTLYCDVCDLPLLSIDAIGKAREVEISELVSGENAAFQSEKPPLARQHLQLYAGQCLDCGRWGGRGKNHVYCFDAKKGTCTKCME